MVAGASWRGAAGEVGHGQAVTDLLKSAEKHAADAGLEEAEKTKALEIDASSQGEVEASISATVTKAPPALGWFNGGTITAYGKYAWEGAKGFVWGTRYKKELK